MKRVSKAAWVLVGIWLVFVLGALARYVLSADGTAPKYTIVGGADDYEIRTYDEYLEARVSITGSRSFALIEGTRVLNAYIRGDNTLQEAVASARPEGVEPGPASARISDWAPVVGYERGDSFDIAMMLPRSYTIVTLPRPNNPAIRIVQVPSATYAVTGWRGASDAGFIAEKETALRGILGGQKRAVLSTARTVHYARPWMPSVLELNEIQIPVGPDRE